MEKPAKTCGNCGFLAKVLEGMPSRTDSDAVDYEERHTGNIGVAKAICKVSKLSGISVEHDVLAVYEVTHALQPTVEVWITRRKATKEVFDRPRDTCAGWFEWNPDLTPKEHYEERRMLQLEDIRREEVKRTQSAQERDFKISLAAIGLALFIGLAQIWVAWRQTEIRDVSMTGPIVVVTPTPTAMLVPPTPSPSATYTPTAPTATISASSP